MTQNPIPDHPPMGQIRFFDSIQPALAQGDYSVTLEQTFPSVVDGVTTGMSTQTQSPPSTSHSQPSSQSQLSGILTSMGLDPGTSIIIPSSPPFCQIASASAIIIDTIAMIPFLLFIASFILFLQKIEDATLGCVLSTNYLSSSFLSILSKISAILLWSLTILVITCCILR